MIIKYNFILQIQNTEYNTYNILKLNSNEYIVNMQVQYSPGTSNVSTSCKYIIKS